MPHGGAGINVYAQRARSTHPQGTPRGDGMRHAHEWITPRRGSRVLLCAWCPRWRFNPRTLDESEIIREVTA